MASFSHVEQVLPCLAILKLNYECMGVPWDLLKIEILECTEIVLLL